MPFRDKILHDSSLAGWRQALRDRGRILVATNGCFDLLHLGHVSYLEAARAQGDALLVAVNGDAGVRSLKGPGRPINQEEDRAAVVAALECVSAVFIFREPTALEFLKRVKPEIYAKGGDYTIDTINQEERRLIESMGGRVAILPKVPGASTSELAARIASL